MNQNSTFVFIPQYFFILIPIHFFQNKNVIHHFMHSGGMFANTQKSFNLAHFHMHYLPIFKCIFLFFEIPKIISIHHPAVHRLNVALPWPTFIRIHGLLLNFFRN